MQYSPYWSQHRSLSKAKYSEDATPLRWGIWDPCFSDQRGCHPWTPINHTFYYPSCGQVVYIIGMTTPLWLWTCFCMEMQEYVTFSLLLYIFISSDGTKACIERTLKKLFPLGDVCSWDIIQTSIFSCFKKRIFRISNVDVEHNVRPWFCLLSLIVLQEQLQNIMNGISTNWRTYSLAKSYSKQRKDCMSIQVY